MTVKIVSSKTMDLEPQGNLGILSRVLKDGCLRE